MSPNYDHLEWDSDFFGFNVARMTMIDFDEIHFLSTLKSLKNENYRLIYWSLPPSVNVEDGFLKRYGGFLADEKITYLKKTDGTNLIDKAFLYSTVPYSFKEPEPTLLKLALESGEFSRFRCDPLFPPELFEKLYHHWIIRAVRKEIAWEVLVVKDMDGTSGVVTLGAKEERGDIGLLAVSSRARGRGLGKLLMRDAEKAFIKHGYAEVQVVTQKRNVVACRLYESFGYRVEKIENVYHFWLNEN